MPVSVIFPNSIKTVGYGLNGPKLPKESVALIHLNYKSVLFYLKNRGVGLAKQSRLSEAILF